MPTYDYHCDACGHRFEHWQQISEKKLSTCPKCRKKKLQRLIGAGSGLIFKGTGFYVTDYKRKGTSGGTESSSAGSGEGTGAQGTTGATGKTDAKGASGGGGAAAASPSGASRSGKSARKA